MDSEAGVFAMAFDHSGTRLITAEADKTIKLYREDDTAVSILSAYRINHQFYLQIYFIILPFLFWDFNKIYNNEILLINFDITFEI